MAITYLSGERIQGILGADVAAVADYVNDAQAGSLHVDSIGGHKDYIGVQVATGHAAVGTIFSEFTFWAWADQSPDGKIGLQIVTPPASGTSLGTIKGTSTTTVEANTITTNQSGTSMTFAAPLDGSGDAITLADGDVVTLYDVEGTINSGDGGQIQPVMGSNTISNQQKLAWNSGGGSAGWVTYADKSFKWKGTKALIPAVDEKSTITNVPYGTRYEETDTRKIFRRKSGGGAAQNTNIFNLTYSAEKQASVTAGNDPTGKATVAHEGQNPESKVYTTGLTTTGNTKTFEIKFKLLRGGSDSGNNWGIFFGSDVWDDDNTSGTNKRIFVRMVNGNTFQFSLEDAAGTNEDASMTIQGTGTTKYYTITGNGTTAKCEYWASSDRSGSADVSSGNVSFPTAWLTRDVIDTVTFGGWGGGGNTINIDVHDVSIKWDNGIEDSWVEKGTA